MSEDLISRKEVVEALRARGRELLKLGTSFETQIASVTALECVNIVKDAPAVDAEPVRHGEWVNVRTSAFCPYEMELEEKCSLCGRYVYRYGTQPKDEYCPTCGAKMDGGKIDE